MWVGHSMQICACLHAVQSAADLGIQRVILEFDAFIVAQAVISLDFDRCPASGLVWELKNLLLSNFVAYDVAHNPRS